MPVIVYYLLFTLSRLACVRYGFGVVVIGEVFPRSNPTFRFILKFDRSKYRAGTSRALRVDNNTLERTIELYPTYVLLQPPVRYRTLVVIINRVGVTKVAKLNSVAQKSKKEILAVATTVLESALTP